MAKESSSNWPVVERGAGLPVVFLHGYPLNHEMWAPQLTSLSNGRRVILLDLPGYGLAHDGAVPDTLGGFADSVHETLSRRFSVPVVIVGHSFGGYVALEMFRRHPELFAGLVLTDTRSEPDSPEAREKRLATAGRLGKPGEGLDIDQTARALLAPETWEGPGPVTDVVRGMIRAAQPLTLIATLKAIAGRPDLSPVLAEIRVPTLVIWGEEDQLIPPAQTQSMVPRIRGAIGVGIPKAGHLPSLEAPEAFARPIRDLLASVRSP